MEPTKRFAVEISPGVFDYYTSMTEVFKAIKQGEIVEVFDVTITRKGKYREETHFVRQGDTSLAPPSDPRAAAFLADRNRMNAFAPLEDSSEP